MTPIKTHTRKEKKRKKKKKVQHGGMTVIASTIVGVPLVESLGSPWGPISLQAYII
jgi:hypothetical protein